MEDRFGRKIEYLRISVTDRCNLRCIYCMPGEGVEWVPHDTILRFEEIVRLVRVLAPLGIRRIRLTGGEPLVRLGLCDLVAALREIDGIDQINLTTNGVLFAPMAEQLQRAGLHGVNFSLDTLRADVFRRITRTDRFAEVREGIDRSGRSGRPGARLSAGGALHRNDAHRLRQTVHSRDDTAGV